MQQLNLMENEAAVSAIHRKYKEFSSDVKLISQVGLFNDAPKAAAMKDKSKQAHGHERLVKD